MSQTTTNTEIVARAYQAFNEADIETLSRLFDDNASWQTPGHSSAAGVAHGQEAVFAQFGRYGGETNGTFKADLKALFEGEDGRVIGLHHNSGERNGKVLGTDCCIVFELTDGRVTSGREFFFDLHNWDQFWS